MNVIIGMIDLALDTEVEAERRDYLETARGCAHGLLRIINDMLDFSKMEAGKLAIEKTQFDVGELLHEIIRSLKPAANEKELRITCNLSPEVPGRVISDSGRLRQILMNLIGNAIKFTHQGEVTIRVRLDSTTGIDNRLRFSISDTGIGIAKDRQQQIFQPFVQVDGSNTRRYGGTGLGLAIASQLVDLMEGQIWLESEVGHGTTFYFTVGAEPAPELRNQLPSEDTATKPLGLVR